MFMLNLQPREVMEDGTLDGAGLALDVIDVWPTIQGEGVYAGTPAVFIRLAGCNMDCPMCDTDYTSNRKMMALCDVTAEVKRHMKETWNLVVITGGEPFRQPIGPLLDRLASIGGVQIETNGTGWQPKITWGRFHVCCSPKGSKLHPQIVNRIDSFKYVLREGEVSKKDGLPTKCLGLDHPPARPPYGFLGDVFVQPLDEQDPTRNTLNMKACVESAMKFGYRVGVQLHKTLGVP